MLEKFYQNIILLNISTQETSMQQEMEKVGTGMSECLKNSTNIKFLNIPCY